MLGSGFGAAGLGVCGFAEPDALVDGFKGV